MAIVRIVALIIVSAGLVVGTLLDRVPTQTPHQEAGYTVLTADFHVHTLFGDGGVPPWELAREARRRGIDVVIVSNHNQRIAARIATATTDTTSLPLIIPGQEITTPSFHMIAAGTSHTIDWRLSARDAIRAVQAQGGVAIAAHPIRVSWRAADEEAVRLLDGTEVAHPLSFDDPRGNSELQGFFRSASRVNTSLAPIGASDFHFGGSLGVCRTYVFVRDVSQPGVLEAVRDARTVASCADGPLMGDPTLVAAVQRVTASRRRLDEGRAPLAAWTTLAGVVILLLFR